MSTTDSNTSADESSVQLSLRVPGWLRDALYRKAERDRRSANVTAAIILEHALSDYRGPAS